MPKRTDPSPDSKPDLPPRSASSGAASEDECRSRGTQARKPGFGSYQSALAFLMDRVNVERIGPGRVNPHAFKFERTVALMEALDNPHKGLACVHVAGSKGKGGVCEMSASCLEACGFAVGLYTSPHLIDLRERIRINQSMISEEDFRLLMGKVASVLPKLEREWGEPTFFEVITALAFLYFAEQAVDLAVVEVGLGGRLDSTNVITPRVSAITAIQLEHTDILGTTLPEIAREKAGIIKPGVPCLTIPQQDPSILRVFREVAAERGTSVRVVGEDIDYSCRFESSPELGPHARVCVSTGRSAFEHLPVPLKGEHQAMNCGLVLSILDSLRGDGFAIGDREVALGLSRTPTRGRLELVHSSPRIIVDGAHNPESIAALVKAVGAHMRYDSMVVVFGCAKDKDVAGMMQRLALGADKVIFTKAGGSSRAMEPRELLRKFAEASGKMAQVAPTVREALNMAAQAVGRDDVICVTGSFYIAGEAKRLLMEKYSEASGNAQVGLAQPATPPALAEVKPTPGSRKMV